MSFSAMFVGNDTTIKGFNVDVKHFLWQGHVIFMSYDI